MKLFHISDLHIGKRVNGFSMIDDQKFVFGEIERIVERERPEGILLSGDIYDNHNPSEEAVRLFSDILTGLSSLTKVFIISGNHDSDEKLAFASGILKKANVYISPVFKGEVDVVELDDEYGKVRIHLLPFLKPQDVRHYHEEREIKSYDDAIRAVLENHEIDLSERNVLLSHQFVTGASTSDSEEMSVGGVENIGADVYRDYDYVALGHLHRPQNLNVSNKMRYAGSPLKYSFSEEFDTKSITVVELREKGNVVVDTIPIPSLHGMHTIEGSYNDVMQKKFYEGTTYQNDYLRVVLTDENELMDALSRLRSVYPFIMMVEWKRRGNGGNEYREEELSAIKKRKPLDIIRDFYGMQVGTDMNENQEKYLVDTLESIDGGDR